MRQFKFFSLLLVLLALNNAYSTYGSDWKSIGPYGGHAHKIIIDPNNHDHLYVTTKNGQIYRSVDAGQHWESLPFALSSAASLNAIALNPANPDELYVGVAQNSGTFVEPGEAGIYKTEDAGLHWTRMESTSGWSVYSLAIHPFPQILMAGTEDGIFRSEDTGVTWQRISPANHPEIKVIVSLAIDSADPRVVYAGTPHLPWKTSNGGLKWERIYQGMADDSDIFSIAIDRSSAQAIVLGACSGIYRSLSGGVRWLRAPGIPEPSRRTYQIVQDPVNAKMFYAATVQGLWKSVNGGLNWKKTNPYPYVVNSVAIDPVDPKTIYLATDRSGLLKSIDGGATFAAINEGFVNRNVTRLISAANLYISTVYDGDFGGIFATDGPGLTWTLNANQPALQGRNIISLALSPGNPELVYAGSYDGLLRSDDAGKTWRLVEKFSHVEAARGKIYDIAFSHADSNTIFVASNHGLFESTDAGDSWKKSAAPELDTAIYKLSLHPVDSSRIMLQTSRGLLVSRDGGLTWDVVSVSADEPVVYDFTFAPAPQGRIFATTSNGLFFSDDDGRVWTRTAGLPSIPLRQILFVRDQPQKIYVMSSVGHQIWGSADNGIEWFLLDNRGLEMASSLLFMGVSGRQFFAVTENHGVFSLETDTLLGSR